jgi:predicted NUDIX family NTP pyrophosphohydrolase
MSLVEQAYLVLYRVCHQGLEVFLVKQDPEIDNWSLPPGAQSLDNTANNGTIELEPVQDENGQARRAVAVEGDWHDIPSLKSLMLQDAHDLKDKIFEVLPELERHGTFVGVKEAVKKVMPQQYAMIKELRDIVTARNSVKDL